MLKKVIIVSLTLVVGAALTLIVLVVIALVGVELAGSDGGDKEKSGDWVTDLFKDGNIEHLKKNFNEETRCPVEKVSVKTHQAPSIANHSVGSYTVTGCQRRANYSCHSKCSHSGISFDNGGSETP